MRSAEGVFQLYIDGEWVGNQSGESFAVYEPSTEEEMARVLSAGPFEVDRALTTLMLADWFTEAGLPPGVINIVNGIGETCGVPLVEHLLVDKIAFTGSTEVGKSIVRRGADTLKRVTLELGGKSPNIFFADADWEASVDGALFGIFINQGEVCSAGSRILVEKKIYSKFVEAMAEKAKTIRLGAPLDRETKMGPVVSKEQYER
ncbi:MAG: betaine-aldehyde dehydrogenase, partial [Acidobacteriaceae bacterium]|nr:betaine-aldehyde dehydrogenase [Acidobacteriaceae bacterium]